MQPSWREHLVDEGDGTMRIKAHGMMKADARLVTDAHAVYHDVDPLHPLHVHRPDRINVSGNTHLPTVVVDVGI